MTKNPRQGVDIGHTDVAREIGAPRVSAWDSKFNEEVCEFINSTWRERER